MISKHREAWEELGDPVATDIMNVGFRLSFQIEPSLSYHPPHARISKANLPIFRPLIPEYLSRGIIREITTPQPLFFSSVFPTPKKDDTYRPIINLSILNTMLVPQSFKMETVAKIATCLTVALWGITMDLKDAFFHVPIAWEYHKYFAFKMDGHIYVFQFLPFGLSPAPWAFSRTIKPIKSHLHELSIMMFSLLDDFLILAPSQVQLEETAQKVIKCFQKLGLSINVKNPCSNPHG